MKTILILAATLCIGLSTKNSKNLVSQNISGKVIDMEDKPIFGASVFIHGSKKGTITDSLGEFNMIVPADVERLVVNHYRYAEMVLEINGRKVLLIKLKDGEPEEKIARQRKLDGDKVLKLKGMPTMARKEAPMTERVPLLSSASEVKGEMMHDAVFSESKVDDYYMEESEALPDAGVEWKDSGNKKNVRAGQLTAGEWNDLNNWEAWNKLINEADYKDMAEYWGINSDDRVSVFVTNQYELPIADCLVTLRSNNEIIWTSKTDNAGKAELWIDGEEENLELIVESRSNKGKISAVKRVKDGMNRIQFKEECDAPSKAEVMFVVDATGSMGDEIEFLKSELRDVIDQVEASRSSVEFRWGSVFYRDASDDYLTRQSPLTSKTKKVLDFIKMQSAGGGGDYPEAVNEGLEEALMQEWSDDAIARIIFLVLDAPPHHDPEVLKDLQSQIAFASAMGIKLIPITASGINRQTEYLMKFMSIQTNGTYVFLTDHSGIGNAHLDPVVKDFEVEKLNDLLKRVIGNYTDRGTCVKQEDNNPVFAGIEVFPNPTVDMLQVKVPEGISKITLTTSSGMAVHSVKVDGQCDISIDLSTYVDGMYVLNFYGDSSMNSIKVVKSGKA